MTTYPGERCAVCVGVADIRRSPDPASELVTQALLNTPAVAGGVDGAWTHVTLPDYSGWICTNKLAAERGALARLAVVSATHTPLYGQSEGEDILDMAYLSSALPLLHMTTPERVQVALPDGRRAWLRRDHVAARARGASIYPLAPPQAITACACAFLGRPYLWGGTSWEGIDCSGFVQLCYRMGGYMLPRDADQQHDFLEHSVERGAIQQGDLIFFGSAAITHVALALNGREYIHAEGQNYNRVVINSFDATAAHYYPRLDEIVWSVKRVAA